MGGPIAQYPIVNAVPFPFPSRLRSRHYSLAGLFPRACRQRLVDRRPVPVVRDLPGLRDAILSPNCAPDFMQPRGKNESALNATEICLLPTALAVYVISSTRENASQTFAFDPETANS